VVQVFAGDTEIGVIVPNTGGPPPAQNVPYSFPA